MTAAPQTPSTTFDPARLVREHQAGVWRYLRALGCEPALADDLTQETFLAVFQKPFHDYNPASTAAYLRKVAYNLFITFQRRSGRVVHVVDMDEIDQEWERLMGDDGGTEMLLALRGCFEELTPRAKLALELRFKRQESRENIAAALEITEHGAKNLMQRAKQQLRECIEGKVR